MKIAGIKNGILIIKKEFLLMILRLATWYKIKLKLSMFL